MTPIERIMASPEWSRLSADLRSLLFKIFGDYPRAIVVYFRFLEEAKLPLYLHLGPADTPENPGGAPPPPRNRRRRDPYHTTDFQLVTWRDYRWNFSPMQRIVIKKLWEAWESGQPEVSQRTLLDAARSECDALRDLFREHAAWGVLIVRAGPTLYKLAFPQPGEDPGNDTGEMEDVAG